MAGKASHKNMELPPIPEQTNSQQLPSASLYQNIAGQKDQIHTRYITLKGGAVQAKPSSQVSDEYIVMAPSYVGECSELNTKTEPVFDCNEHMYEMTQYERRTVTDNIPPQHYKTEMQEYRSNRKKKRIKYCVFGVLIALCFLVAIGGLCVALVSHQTGVQKFEAGTAAFSSNSDEMNNYNFSLDLERLNAKMESLQMILASLTNRTSNLEDAVNDSITAILASFNTQIQSTSTAVDAVNNSITTIRRVLSSFGSHLQSTSASVDAVNGNITSIRRDLSSFGSHLQTASASVDAVSRNITSIRRDLASFGTHLQNTSASVDAVSGNITSIRRDLSSFGSHLQITSAFVNSLNTTLHGKVNLFHSCYRDVVSCTVAQHRTNNYWFLCLTSYRPVNVTVSSIVW